MNQSMESTLFEWALALFLVITLGCFVYKSVSRSGADGDGSNHPNGNAISISISIHNYTTTAGNVKRNEEEEEEERRTVIFKLFQSEHIQEKLTCNNIRRNRSISIGSASTKECHSTDGDFSSDDDNDMDEELGQGMVLNGDSDETHDNNNTNNDNYDDNDDDNNNNNNNSSSNNSCYTETTHQDAGSGKTVDNLCAICLEEYHEGDIIVWASNKNCRHAFHRDCLATYLAKIKAKDAYESYPCPCCRQNFFFADDDDDATSTDRNENNNNNNSNNNNNNNNNNSTDADDEHT